MLRPANTPAAIRDPMTSSASTRIAIRGDLLDFVAAPAWGVTDHATDAAAVRFRPDHWLLVDAGRIVGAQPASEPLDDRWQRHDHAGRLLLPGFIDTHVHSPQIDVIASYGTGLAHADPGDPGSAARPLSRYFIIWSTSPSSGKS